MREFEGKNAMILGGTSGIGLATALLLRERGAVVTVVSNQTPAPQAGMEPLCWRECDVRDPEMVRTAVAWATRHRPLDCLVYSVGIQRYGSVTKTTLDEWDAVQQVNARGFFLAAHYAIPTMSRGGSIVAVSSVQAAAVQAGVAAYAASKGTLDSLVRSIAVDYAAQGIRANTVRPGTIDTPMIRASADRLCGAASSDALVEEWGRFHPIGRVAQPREVAEVIAFLLSDRSSFVAGATFDVDGGLLATLPVRL